MPKRSCCCCCQCVCVWRKERGCCRGVHYNSLLFLGDLKERTCPPSWPLSARHCRGNHYFHRQRPISTKLNYTSKQSHNPPSVMGFYTRLSFLTSSVPQLAVRSFGVFRFFVVAAIILQDQRFIYIMQIVPKHFQLGA